jgi:hypothetical protein
MFFKNENFPKSKQITVKENEKVGEKIDKKPYRKRKEKQPK